MSMLRSPSALAGDSGGAQLAVTIAACQLAITPSRALDGEIALAVFPALIELPRVEAGIWSQADGTRVRALRYFAVRSAAATPVPPGCRSEERRVGKEGVSTGRSRCSTYC